MSNASQSGGIVYVLTNEAMPGLVKIGKTTRRHVAQRLGELYTTGVPVPFECAFAGRVDDEIRVERAFHRAFGPYRLNSNREFFTIEPEQAIALLELLIVEDVTPGVAKHADQVDPGSQKANEVLRRRNRPNLDFHEMGIPDGSTLEFTMGDNQCRVVGNRKVEFDGEEQSITAVTRFLLRAPRNVAPTPYWTFKGRSLRDIYNDTYPFDP